MSVHFATHNLVWLLIEFTLKLLKDECWNPGLWIIESLLNEDNTPRDETIPPPVIKTIENLNPPRRWYRSTSREYVDILQSMSVEWGWCYHCVFFNVFSNHLPVKRQIHIGCICLAFLHCVFSSVPLKHLTESMNTHTDCTCSASASLYCKGSSSFFV